jgi:hypothetical protein
VLNRLRASLLDADGYVRFVDFLFVHDEYGLRNHGPGKPGGAILVSSPLSPRALNRPLFPEPSAIHALKLFVRLCMSDNSPCRGNTLLQPDGAFLLGLSIIVTILGTQMYYRLRGQRVNNSVAGLVMGMCTGAVVFSDVTYDLFGNLPHRAIRLDSQVRFNLLRGSTSIFSC